MSTWAMGALGAMAGLGQGLQQVGLMQFKTQQMQQERQQEEQIAEQKMRVQASLTAPAEKQVKRTGSDGTNYVDTQQWVPPADNSTPGYYKTVGTEVVPVNYKVDKISTGPGITQTVMYPENGDMSKVKYIGAPDNTEALRTAADQTRSSAEVARVGLEGKRVDLEAQRLKNDMANGGKQSMVPHTIDLPSGAQVQGNLVPGKGFVPMQTPSGDFAVKAPKLDDSERNAGMQPAPTDFNSINSYFSPKSNFPGSFTMDDVKQTPMAQLNPSATNTGGSGSQQTPRPSQPSKGAMGGDGAGPTPQATAQGQQGKPSLQQWLPKARASNPGVSDSDLTAYYAQKYGG